MNRQRELWAVALWVEKEHGEDGWDFISRRQQELFDDSDPDGVLFWNEVGEMYDQLRAKPERAAH